MHKRLWVFALMGLLLLVAFPAGAQSRSVFWEDWNVLIDNVDTTENRFDVVEEYNLDFTGTFQFGSRVIPLDRLERITNVRVYEDGNPLREGCGGQRGTYCVETTSDGLSITYNFSSPITNGQRNFEIEYTVHGALRVYEGGDQLSWYAIPPEHFGFRIGRARVTVEMPDGYAPREGIDPVVTYGAPTNVEVRDTTITATATREIRGDEALEIRVQYPHDPNARMAGWQNSFDQRRNFEDTVLPILNILFLLLSLAVGIGGPLFFYTLWQRKGRDPKVGPVPEYLSEPPSDLRPAIVGTLLDEQADMRDVMSTLIDLAHRGYLVIEEDQRPGLLGIGRTMEFTFKRTDKSFDDLRKYEKRLVNGIFGNRMERSLESLRNKFYTVIPKVQEDLYQELVNEALFDRKPNTTRAMWSSLGVVLLVLAGGVFFFGVSALEGFSSTLILLPFALGLTGIAALIAAQFMPAKTRRGAEEAAKWKAFQEYLRNIEKYGDVEGAVSRFDEFLPYAVAFGIDRTWMSKFKRVESMPLPPWYYPTYVGGPYGRGYTAGTPMSRGGSFGGHGLPGDLARAEGGFSMETLSQNMAMSMENLSSGIANMMESASRAMTSRPQSSSSGTSGRWGGGGGSWSGGGSSGGGSSGGGSSGFG